LPTILIVDDSAFQQTFVKNVLAPQGYELLAASNGLEALDLLEEREVDCVIADLIMPKMRGMKLLEVLGEKNFQVPVIILTADIQEHIREQCLALGARAVLHKPVRPQVLCQTVAEVLPREEDA
jgi:CheY-like chemotaxis protein